MSSLLRALLALALTLTIAPISHVMRATRLVIVQRPGDSPVAPIGARTMFAKLG